MPCTDNSLAWQTMWLIHLLPQVATAAEKSPILSYESTEFCRSVVKCQWKYFPSPEPRRWWGQGSGGKWSAWPPEVCHTSRMGAQLMHDSSLGGRLLVQPWWAQPQPLAPHHAHGMSPTSQGLTLSGSKGTLRFSNLWFLPWLFYLLDFLGPRPGYNEIPGACKPGWVPKENDYLLSYCKTLIHKAYINAHKA